MLVPSSVKTERLIIRRYVPDDFVSLSSFFSDQVATRLLDMTPEQKTKEATCALLDAVIASYETNDPIFATVIVAKAEEGGKFVVSCGMAPRLPGAR